MFQNFVSQLLCVFACIKHVFGTCSCLPRGTPGCVVSYHLHIKLPGSSWGASSSGFRFPERVLHCEVVLALAASPAPHEQQQETEENNSQERDTTHGCGDQDGGQVQGKLEKNTCAVQICVIEVLAAVQWAVEKEGRSGVQRLAAHCECGKVGVIASGIASDADVCSAVSKLGIADLQGATRENSNTPWTLGCDPSALWGNPDNNRCGLSFSSTQKTHGLAFTGNHLQEVGERNSGEELENTAATSGSTLLFIYPVIRPFTLTYSFFH